MQYLFEKNFFYFFKKKGLTNRENGAKMELSKKGVPFETAFDNIAVFVVFCVNSGGRFKSCGIILNRFLSQTD